MDVDPVPSSCFFCFVFFTTFFSIRSISNLTPCLDTFLLLSCLALQQDTASWCSWEGCKG
jgi:hypothetical protein